MPQSLGKLHIHLIFSTKYREPFLQDDIRGDLHAYIAVILQTLGCVFISINSVEDHVHILFELARTVAVSDVVEEVKKGSSKWMKKQGAEYAGFRWQAGYAVFAVSASEVAAIGTYIAGQREHHLAQAFPDEYRAFLEQHGVVFDERYLWD